MTPPRAALGMLLPDEPSLRALGAAAAARGLGRTVVGEIAAGPGGESDYPELAAQVRALARRAERIVVGARDYGTIVPWLREDLGIAVERSDAAGTRALIATLGTIGILAEGLQGAAVADYVGEVLAQTESRREIWHAPSIASLRACDVLFVPQFAAADELAAICAVWAGKPLVSALDAILAELAAMPDG